MTWDMAHSVGLVSVAEFKPTAVAATAMMTTMVMLAG